jgi:steroid 5-alpha reductase family enzyme
MTMQLRTLINLHKGLTAPVVGLLMLLYANTSTAAWVYLALHGTYGVLWLIKDWLFPDRQWQRPVSWIEAPIGFLVLGLYWLAPWLLISSGAEAPPALLAAAIALNLLGSFLHFGSDAQKHFTLAARPGLICDGFFRYSRNPNYLGEILIYASFALLAMHWQPWLVLAGFAIGVFLPNMRRKDESLARHPEFAAWKERTGLLLPKLIGAEGARVVG